MGSVVHRSPALGPPVIDSGWAPLLAPLPPSGRCRRGDGAAVAAQASVAIETNRTSRPLRRSTGTAGRQRIGEAVPMGWLHLEVHYGVDLASDPRPISNLCASLLDVGFGSHARVLEYERDP